MQKQVSLGHNVDTPEEWHSCLLFRCRQVREIYETCIEAEAPYGLPDQDCKKMCLRSVLPLPSCMYYTNVHASACKCGCCGVSRRTDAQTHLAITCINLIAVKQRGTCVCTCTDPYVCCNRNARQKQVCSYLLAWAEYASVYLFTVQILHGIHCISPPYLCYGELLQVT